MVCLAAGYSWFLLQRVARQRYSLFSVFLVIPTGFLRALASKHVQVGGWGGAGCWLACTSTRMLQSAHVLSSHHTYSAVAHMLCSQHTYSAVSTPHPPASPRILPLHPSATSFRHTLAYLLPLRAHTFFLPPPLPCSVCVCACVQVDGDDDDDSDEEEGEGQVVQQVQTQVLGPIIKSKQVGGGQRDQRRRGSEGGRGARGGGAARGEAEGREEGQ